MTAEVAGTDSDKSRRCALWLAFGAALVPRFLAAGFAGGISHDAAVFYLPGARVLFEGGFGNWREMSVAVPPLFPPLVALLAHVAGDVETAAVAISIIAGAAMVFPVAMFTERFFPGNTMARHAALVITVLHPDLVRHAAEARADALYALCFAFALWWGARVVEEPSPGRGALFGVLTGIAYLLRPEALGLVVLIAAAAVFRWIRHRREAMPAPRAIAVASAWLLVIACLAPALAWNMAFVHARLGVWTLSPKAALLAEFNKVPGEDPFLHLNAARTMTLYEEKTTDPHAFERLSLARAIAERPWDMSFAVARNLGAFANYLPNALGVLPSIAFLVGAWCVVRRREVWRRLAPFLAVILFYAAVLSLFYVKRRFWLPFLPLFLPVCGAGIAAVTAALERRWPARRWGCIALVCTALCLVPETVHRWIDADWGQSPERALGERMASRAEPGALYVSTRGKVTWFARGRHLFLPVVEPLDAIESYMANRGARYLVLDDDRAPGLARELAVSASFREIDRSDDSEIRVYERED